MRVCVEVLMNHALCLLASSQLGSEGCNAISSKISMLTNIAVLDLHDNGFNQSMVSLVAWISQNKSITTLDLSQNMSGVTKRCVNLLKSSANVLFIKIILLIKWFIN